MYAGATLSFWIDFAVLVVLLLIVDLAVLPRFKGRAGVRAAWVWTAVLAGIALCFAVLITRAQGHERGMEFLSGYLVEGSLSVDNLFVFLLMFRSLGLDEDGQHRVLFWGVLGAIVMRGVFIFVGAALLERFLWVEYIFGAFLLFAAFGLLRQKPGQEHAPRLAERLLHRAGSGGASGQRLPMPAFLLIVLAVETTDLIFALDSVPAVLSITRDPFVVFTSNIFAVLGLRSLYFALAGALDKMRLLHYGLALILLFVGIKMLLSSTVTIPVTWSLAFIVVVIAIFAAASRLTAKKQPVERPQS